MKVPDRGLRRVGFRPNCLATIYLVVDTHPEIPFEVRHNTATQLRAFPAGVAEPPSSYLSNTVFGGPSFRSELFADLAVSLCARNSLLCLFDESMETNLRQVLMAAGTPFHFYRSSGLPARTKLLCATAEDVKDLIALEKIARWVHYWQKLIVGVDNGRELTESEALDLGCDLLQRTGDSSVAERVAQIALRISSLALYDDGLIKSSDPVFFVSPVLIGPFASRLAMLCRQHDVLLLKSVAYDFVVDSYVYNRVLNVLGPDTDLANALA